MWCKCKRSDWPAGPALSTFGTIDLFTHEAVAVADTADGLAVPDVEATVVLFTDHLVVLANAPTGPVTSRCVCTRIHPRARR